MFHLKVSMKPGLQEWWWDRVYGKETGFFPGRWHPLLSRRKRERPAAHLKLQHPMSTQWSCVGGSMAISPETLP
jgi:hypothetical protein